MDIKKGLTLGPLSMLHACKETGKVSQDYFIFQKEEYQTCFVVTARSCKEAEAKHELGESIEDWREQVEDYITHIESEDSEDFYENKSNK